MKFDRFGASLQKLYARKQTKQNSNRMKNYYSSVMNCATIDHKRKLVKGINSSQRGNESQISGDLSKYSVTTAKMDRIANLIGASFAPVKA